MSQEPRVPGDIIGMCRSLAEDVRISDWNARAIQTPLRSIRAGDAELPRRFTLSRLQYERLERRWAGILGWEDAMKFVPLYAPLYHPEFPLPLRPAHPRLLQIAQQAIFWAPVREVKVLVTEGGEWHEQLNGYLDNSLKQAFGEGVAKPLDEFLRFSDISTNEVGEILKDIRKRLFPDFDEEHAEEDPRYEASFELTAPLDSLLYFAGSLSLTKGLGLAFRPALDMWDLGNWPLNVNDGIVEVLCAPGIWKED